MSSDDDDDEDEVEDDDEDEVEDADADEDEVEDADEDDEDAKDEEPTLDTSPSHSVQQINGPTVSEGASSSQSTALVAVDSASHSSSPAQPIQNRRRDYKRQIESLEQQLVSSKRQLARTKVALACSNSELLKNGLDIPNNSKMVGGEATNGEFGIGSNLQRVITVCRAETNVLFRECPYRMDITGMPDTTITVSDTKFKESFPHAILTYKKTGDFSAHVEQRRPISIQAKLVHRQKPEVACDERDLKPGTVSPQVQFRLLLLTESGKEVCFEDLEESAKRIKTLTEPNIIGACEKMQNGTVTFNIHELKVYSSHTKLPKSQKFKFKIECVDPQLKLYEHMHAETITFYSVSRIRLSTE